MLLGHGAILRLAPKLIQCRQISLLGVLITVCGLNHQFHPFIVTVLIYLPVTRLKKDGLQTREPSLLFSP